MQGQATILAGFEHDLHTNVSRTHPLFDT
jgi:hypothetical protein